MTQAIAHMAKNDSTLRQHCLALGMLMLTATALPRLTTLEDMPTSRMAAIASDSGESAHHLGLAGLKLEGIAYGGEASLGDLDRHHKDFTAEEQRRSKEQPTQQLIQ